MNTKAFSAKSKSPLIEVQCNHFRTSQSCKLHGTHSDWARSNDQHKISGLDFSAINTVHPDRKGLNQGQGIEPDSPTCHEVCRRDDQVIHHPTVDVHATYLEVCTTVRFALPARDTPTAIEIRQKCNDVAFLERVRTVHFNDLTSQLVTQGARVCKVGLCSFKSVQVGTADTDSPNAQHRFVLAGHGSVPRRIA